jgi:hypothetical protein
MSMHTMQTHRNASNTALAFSSYSKETTDPTIQKIISLDLGPIKFKLVVEKGLNADVVDEHIRKYKRFLILMHLKPEVRFAPDHEIDDIWHAHILDTEKYRTDCNYIFGRFIDHFPYFGLRSEQDRQELDLAYAETKAVYLNEFGVEMCNVSLTCGRDGGAGVCNKRVEAVRPTMH